MKKANALPSLILLLVIIISAGADLIGIFLVASTGIEEVNQSYSTSVYFLGIKKDKTEPDPYLEEPTQIFSSIEVYPHILKQEDWEYMAILPIQAGQQVPSSYSGPALVGSFDHICRPADFSGTISLDDLTGISIRGNITSSEEEGLTPRRVNCTASPSFWSYIDKSYDMEHDVLFYTKNNPSFTFVCLLDGGSRWDLRHRFMVLRVKNIDYFNNLNSTINGRPSGRLAADDPGLGGADWSLQTCVISLPRQVGEVSATGISKKPIFEYKSSGVYPRIPIYRSNRIQITSWDKNEMFRRLGAIDNDAWVSSFVAVQPFTQHNGGLLFCVQCSSYRSAAALMSHWFESMDDENMSTALGGALLHSMASYYRVQLAYAKTAYRCQYSLPIAATVINRPALLYAACGYTLLLAHLALLIRLRVLRAVGINRTGSVLSTCAMVQNSLLKSLVDDGSSKSENKFMKAAEAIKDKIRLGTVCYVHAYVYFKIPGFDGKKAE